MKVLSYIELNSGHSDNGTAWIGYVTQSKTRRTLYFNGRGLMKPEGQRRCWDGGNYIDMETNESFWGSGVKKNDQYRHWAGSGRVLIEAAAVAEYLETIKITALDASRCDGDVTNAIRPTDIERLAQLAHAPEDSEARNPYSFRRNVTFPR